MLINTSLNVGGKPLLNRISTALEILRSTELDAAWIEGRLLSKRGSEFRRDMSGLSLTQYVGNPEEVGK